MAKIRMGRPPDCSAITDAYAIRKKENPILNLKNFPVQIPQRAVIVKGEFYADGPELLYACPVGPVELTVAVFVVPQYGVAYVG